jgi:hypothetical protein
MKYDGKNTYEFFHIFYELCYFMCTVYAQRAYVHRVHSLVRCQNRETYIARIGKHQN